MSFQDHTETINGIIAQLRALESQNRKLRDQLTDLSSRLAAYEQLESLVSEAPLKPDEDWRIEKARLLDQLSRLREDPFEWLVESSVLPPKPLRFLYPPVPRLVSAIIPGYRGREYVERCLTSVSAQEAGDYSLEILFCDDGCPSRTNEFVKNLALDLTAPITLLQHPGGANRGVSATRNLAMSHSRGEFLALLDVDDEWLPEKTRLQLDLLRSCNAPAVCSFANCVDHKGRPTKGWAGSDLAGYFPSLVSTGEIGFGVLIESDPVINSTVMMRRRAVECAGGYTDVMAYQAEDWLLFQKLAIEGPLKLIPKALAKYRVHQGSYTSRYIAEGFEAAVRWETHMYLLHWLLQNPKQRELARWVYRKYTPAAIKTALAQTRRLERIS